MDGPGGAMNVESRSRRVGILFEIRAVGGPKDSSDLDNGRLMGVSLDRQS